MERSDMFGLSALPHPYVILPTPDSAQRGSSSVGGRPVLLLVSHAESEFR
jgi:hypothetical protein